jgi:hypothetical protein
MEIPATGQAVNLSNLFRKLVMLILSRVFSDEKRLQPRKLAVCGEDEAISREPSVAMAEKNFILP